MDEVSEISKRSTYKKRVTNDIQVFGVYGRLIEGELSCRSRMAHLGPIAGFIGSKLVNKAGSGLSWTSS